MTSKKVEPKKIEIRTLSHNDQRVVFAQAGFDEKAWQRILDNPNNFEVYEVFELSYATLKVTWGVKKVEVVRQ